MTVLTVALAMHLKSEMLFEAIAQCMPIWIADTPEHDHIRSFLKITPQLPSPTWFPLNYGETLEEAAVRISFSLDDHYNQYVQKEGYKFLLVFGVDFEKVKCIELKELEFARFESTGFGFVAGK